MIWRVGMEKLREYAKEYGVELSDEQLKRLHTNYTKLTGNRTMLYQVPENFLLTGNIVI